MRRPSVVLVSASLELLAVTHIIVHVGSPCKVDASVVCPLVVVEICAFQKHVCAIEEVPIRVDQANRIRPVVRSFSPIRIGMIARVHCQAGGNVEKAAVRNGVLVVVAVVESEDLPPETTVAGRIVPALSLSFKDSLGESEPLCLTRRWVGKVVLSGRHSSHSPKALIIVPFCFGLIGWHEVIVRASLVQHGLRRHVVPPVVAGKIVVIDHGTEHGPRFPPVVWLREVARYVAWSVTGIILHHSFRGGPCSSL